MTWLPLLLADPSPCLRWLVLQRLMGFPSDHPEVQELATLRLSDPLVTELLDMQNPEGAWERGALGPGRKGSHVYTTTIGLQRLGYLGFDKNLPAVAKAAEYLFSQQLPDGSWALNQLMEEEPHEQGIIPKGYDMIPMQTVFPLRALAASGYGTDPRAERAYEWLLRQRVDDGAWPTGKAQGVFGRVAGYRRMPHSLWGCRTNTTGALTCLALHPERRKSVEAQRGLDLLLGRETRERQNVGFETARILGAEHWQGVFTFFARYDLSLVLRLCSQIGGSTEDQRVADLVSFIYSLQGEYGLWEYPSQPQLNRWISYDLLYSISQISASTSWISMEPPSPFQVYPKREKRF